MGQKWLTKRPDHHWLRNHNASRKYSQTFPMLIVLLIMTGHPDRRLWRAVFQDEYSQLLILDHGNALIAGPVVLTSWSFIHPRRISKYCYGLYWHEGMRVYLPLHKLCYIINGNKTQQTAIDQEEKEGTVALFDASRCNFASCGWRGNKF